MAGHTPGPWFTGPTPGYLDGGQSRHAGMGSTITIRSPHHTEEIATVWTYLLPTEANARLIAAAPDMLEALVTVRDRFFPADQPEADRDLLWEPVNAAIAKAEGR